MKIPGRVKTAALVGLVCLPLAAEQWVGCINSGWWCHSEGLDAMHTYWCEDGGGSHHTNYEGMPAYDSGILEGYTCAFYNLS